MKIVIAGGSGYLGRALTASLLGDGHEVVVLSRNPERMSSHPGLQAVGWDAYTPGDWIKSLENSDAVVNFTGENIGAGRWTRRRKAEIRSSREEAGQALVDGLDKVSKKPGLFLQASAIGYYGPSLDETFAEGDRAGSDWLAGVAVDWENSSRGVENLGIRRVITRSGLVLARKATIMDRITLPFRFFIGGPLGSGQQWWSWIHLEDEIGAMRFLLNSPDAAGVYNLTAPEPLRNAIFAKILGRAMHRPAWFPTPGFPLRLILGEMSTLVLDGQRVIPKRLQGAGFAFRYSTLPEALANIFSKR